MTLRRIQVPRPLLLPTDVIVDDPLPDDPDALLTVDRSEPVPTPPPAVDPVEYAAVRDLALALADLQPAPGKSAPTAPVKDAAARVRGRKP